VVSLSSPQHNGITLCSTIDGVSAFLSHDTKGASWCLSSECASFGFLVPSTIPSCILVYFFVFHYRAWSKSDESTTHTLTVVTSVVRRC
jgi:lipoprotein signal peptidase